ncbi:unnamed protein product [Ambrosiozyma monospora]|uniref:Unnamed protein product n=1 Tax=Ambrosiozyma monospora TaxID=43982 RepID=A0ACB5TBU1_AMBMO|nr:unnamed protein product [Ambrosiozyma monospora]
MTTIISKPPTKPTTNQKTIISIIGTTGVGKSQLSISLAQRLNGEIINADSMQMYKNLDQITNKHPIEERAGIEHHVMNHVDWDEEYFIHRFQKEASEKIDEILARGKVPIIVGGTHYYLQSLLFLNKTIEGSSESTDILKTKKKNKLTEEQLQLLDHSDDLHAELVKIDPVVAGKFHPNDTRRIRRCIEVYFETGEKPSDIYRKQTNFENTNSKLKYNTLFFWCYSKLGELDQRLDARVDKMFDNGAATELNQLLEYYKTLPPEPEMDRGVWQVIGFKEFLPYLLKHGELDITQMDNILTNPEFIKCLDEMKMRTRRYARQQVKWIKNLLIPELATEKDHDWRNGGKVYILDATDLKLWDDRVAKRGTEIAEPFLKHEVMKVDQVPESLIDEKLIVERKDEFNKDKWKHYECDICKDKTDKPLVLVGDQWQIHLKSNKHRRNLLKGKRKREYEEYLKNKKKQESKEKQDS